MDQVLFNQTHELPSELLDYTASCLGHSGYREFFEPFFEVIHNLFEAHQCMVFFLGSSSRIEYLLSRNFTDDMIANSLENTYLDGAYNYAKNISTLNRLSIGETKVTHLRDL